MKKKIILIIVAILAVVGCVSAIFLYSYFNPEIRISAGGPVEQKSWYCETIVFTKNGKLGMPISKKMSAKISEFANDILKLTAETQKDLAENYIQDFNVKANYEEKDGKMIFSHIGTATTKDGKKVEYKKEIIFDYIISHDTKLIRNAV
ncbi:MAG: hypothetical protein RR239_03035 [Oscillospiraceae bacterium]